MEKIFILIFIWHFIFFAEGSCDNFKNDVVLLIATTIIVKYFRKNVFKNKLTRVLDLFNIKLSAKFYQNIHNGLRVNFHFFFQNLNFGKTSTNPKCHLTISWATSCQYTNAYAKFHHNISLSSRDRAIFTFSEFGARQNLDQWKMTFHNLLGYILIISMFTQKSIKIFHSVQEIRPFSLFRIWRSAKPRPMINVILQ